MNDVILSTAKALSKKSSSIEKEDNRLNLFELFGVDLQSVMTVGRVVGRLKRFNFQPRKCSRQFRVELLHINTWR